MLGRHLGPIDRARERGFTAIEMIVAMSIISLLIVGVLTVSVETARFTAFADDDYIVQNEVQRSISKMTDILHKTGWADIGGVTFPQVWNQGNELDFVLNGDIDANGYAFNEVTSELEWAPVIYTSRRDPTTGTLGVYVAPEG